uniref:YihY/virulence factor BrkB family protein n=1 Tax=Acetatifactor sp. TaxID=1872090 RepID=UPI004055EB2B
MLRLRKGISIYRNFLMEMKKQDISAHAASTAFFFFLSLVPMLVVICTVIPYTPLTQENLVNVVTEFLPETIEPMAEGLIAEVYEKSAGVLSIALIATIWSAGKGMLAMIQGLNAVNDVEEERNYFLVRTLASFYTVIMLVVILFSLFFVVFGNRLVNLLLYRIPQLQALFRILMKFRFVLVWILLSVLFAMIYAYIPNIKLKFKEQLTGAMFTAVVWSVFSWGFSIYVDSGRAVSVYGSLSIIVIIMLWMYFCMYIFLVGAYMNRYFTEKNREEILDIFR